MASLTKILATLPVLMELEEKGVVSLDTETWGNIARFQVKQIKKESPLKVCSLTMQD